MLGVSAWAGRASAYRLEDVSMLTLPEELARTALDAAPDALIIIDEGGIIRFANRQASTLFGYGHDELVGHVHGTVAARAIPRSPRHVP